MDRRYPLLYFLIICLCCCSRISFKILFQRVQWASVILYSRNRPASPLAPCAGGSRRDLAGGEVEPTKRGVCRGLPHLHLGGGRRRFCKCWRLVYLQKPDTHERWNKKVNSVFCFHVNRCRTLQQLAGVACVNTTKVKFSCMVWSIWSGFYQGKWVICSSFPPSQGYGFQPQYNGDELSCTLRNLRRSMSYKFRVCTLFCL